MAKVLQTEDSFVVLEHRALVALIRAKIRQRKMFLLDAFRAFDADRNGVLTADELYGALTWLGLELTSQNILDLAAHIDSNSKHTRPFCAASCATVR